MALPEEDLPPSWLRDYGDIEADITRMEEFASKLENEVSQNYAPHLSYVYDDMLVSLPQPAGEFGELVSFLAAHHASAQNTADNVYFYRDATGGFATAAKTVSEQYRSADAFSAARVADVESALNQTAAAAPPLPDSSVPVGEGQEPVSAPPPGVV
jgi:hypothetical protein